MDLIILPLTSVPLVGFWKLLPTFGGCIATRANCVLTGNNNEVVEVCAAGWCSSIPVPFGWCVLITVHLDTRDNVDMAGCVCRVVVLGAPAQPAVAFPLTSVWTLDNKPTTVVVWMSRLSPVAFVSRGRMSSMRRYRLAK